MDILDKAIDHLTGEWAVVSGAPVLSILTAILIILGIWRLTQWAFERQIEGLRDQVKALDERLSLAREKFNQAEEQKKRLEADIETLRRQIRQHASAVAIAGTSSSMESNVVTFNQLWDAARTTIAPGTEMSYFMPASPPPRQETKQSRLARFVTALLGPRDPR